MKIRLTFLIVMSAVFMAACPAREPVAPARIDEGAARQGVEQLRTEYLEAYNAGDAARVAALFTDNAVVSVPNQQPVRGRDAIQSNLQQEVQMFGDVSVSAEETRIGADWVAEFGTATQNWRAERPEGAPEQLRSSYGILIVRTAGDQWRIERLVVSADQPVPALPGDPPPTS